MPRKSKYSYEEIKAIMEAKNCILLSTELCKSDEKLDYICLKHADKGIQHISVYHVIDGRGCYYCGRERTNEGRRAKIDKETDKMLCEKCGLEYVNTVVENHIVWIDMICPNHRHVGVQRVKQANLKRDGTHGCIYCTGRKVHPLDSFGNMHKEAVELWSNKNDKSPFEATRKYGLSVKMDCMMIIRGRLRMYILEASDAQNAIKLVKSLVCNKKFGCILKN